MSGLNLFLQYRDKTHYIELFAEQEFDVGEEPILPAENKYTLRHNIHNEPVRTGLTYIKAMILWNSLFAELIEIHSNMAGDYPYSKEQYSNFLSSYLQPDALVLSNTLNTLISEEAEILAK